MTAEVGGFDAFSVRFGAPAARARAVVTLPDATLLAVTAADAAASADALVRAPMIVCNVTPSPPPPLLPVAFVAVTVTSAIPTPATVAIAARYASAIACEEDHIANEIDDTLVENPIYVRVTGEREGVGDGEVDGDTVDEDEITAREVPVPEPVLEAETVLDEDDEGGKFDADDVGERVRVPVTLRVTLGVTVGVPETVMDAVPTAVFELLAPGDKLDVGEALIVLVNDSVVVGERLPVAELVPDGDSEAVGVSLSLRGIGVLVIEAERGIADDVDDKDGVVLGVMLGVERDEGVPLAVPPILSVVVGVGLEDVVVVGV